MTTTILVTIDGLRPDALSEAISPNLLRFQEKSSYTMTASSVMPSMTLPCHTSIFHSVPPERHGITTNEWHPMARPLPGLIEIAHQHGKSCVFFYSWEQLRDLSRPGNLEYSYFVNSNENNGRPDFAIDEKIANAAGPYIQKYLPDFAFVYFGAVDMVGHVYGWMSEEYLAQVSQADMAFGRLLAKLPNDATLLVLSDHGGHDRGHGTDSPEDMTIPWMIAGPGIQRGGELETAVSLLDTAPTLAKLMEIPAPPQWEGRCVHEIFEESKKEAPIG